MGLYSRVTIVIFSLLLPASQAWGNAPVRLSFFSAQEGPKIEDKEVSFILPIPPPKGTKVKVTNIVNGTKGTVTWPLEVKGATQTIDIEQIGATIDTPCANLHYYRGFSKNPPVVADGKDVQWCGMAVAIAKVDDPQRDCKCKKLDFVQLVKRTETFKSASFEVTPDSIWRIDGPSKADDPTYGGYSEKHMYMFDLPGALVDAKNAPTLTGGTKTEKVTSIKTVREFQTWLVCVDPEICVFGYISWAFTIEIKISAEGKVTE